jgi:hypothetical protein
METTSKGSTKVKIRNESKNDETLNSIFVLLVVAPHFI